MPCDLPVLQPYENLKNYTVLNGTFKNGQILLAQDSILSNLYADALDCISSDNKCEPLVPLYDSWLTAVYQGHVEHGQLTFS